MDRVTRLKPACLVLLPALLCGAGVLVVGAVNLFYPNFGYGFLQVLVALFPGYKGTSTLLSVLIAAGYAFTVGSVIGVLVLIGKKLVSVHRAERS